MTTQLIRWEPDDEAAFTGYVGTRAAVAFRVWPPDPAADPGEWQATSPLTGRQRYGRSEEEVKGRAEEMLREFVPSLGAVFATDLREHLEEQAAIHQELGDDHDERGRNIASREHWARAAALRGVLKYLDHELETR
jgi:hypothetical protein